MRNVPVTFTSKHSSQSSRVTSSHAFVGPATPELFTRMSMVPNPASVFSTRAFIAASSVRSVGATREAPSGHLGGGGFEVRDRARREHDFRALARERERDDFSDSLPRPGNDGDFVLQTHCMWLLPMLRIDKIYSAAGSSTPGNQKPSSKAAVSGASEPCVELRSMLSPNSARIVPGSASAGFVAPITSRQRLMASVTLQGQHHRAARGHEGRQIPEKGTLPVNGVKTLRLRFRHLDELHAQNLETLLLDARENFAADAARRGVGLDHRERAFHLSFPFP